MRAIKHVRVLLETCTVGRIRYCWSYKDGLEGADSRGAKGVLDTGWEGTRVEPRQT